MFEFLVYKISLLRAKLDRSPCVRSYERLSLNVSTDNSHSSSGKVIGQATKTNNYSFPKNVA